jgi:hypothetical protein
MLRATVQTIMCAAMLAAGLRAEPLEQLKVHLSLGHRAVDAAPFSVRLVPSGGVEVLGPGVWKGAAGNGHTELGTFVLAYPEFEVKPLQNLQVIWADLIAHSDADTVRRLTQDPAWRIDPRKLTVEMNAQGTRGFSLSIDQLLHNKAFWIPSLDLYIATGASPVSFADYQRELSAHRGVRVLDRVRLAPEASYEQFEDLWEDMGSPNYAHPAQQGPGHIVCLSWDSAIAKFGIDRGAGVWNDYGNPDRFRFWFEFSDFAAGIGRYWKKQTLTDGLPVVTTVLERAGVRYEIEQFAYPLNGPPKQRSGELNMLLMQRVTLTDLRGQARTVPVTLVHERRFMPQEDTDVIAEHEGGRLLLLDAARRNILLAVSGAGAKVAWAGTYESEQKMKRLDITFPVDLPAGGSREFFVTLPSPVVSRGARQTLLDLDYNVARSRTLDFWKDYLAQGAQITVPEKAVNDLFRANLWHALRLPRRHDDGNIDLPYSNFAYDQTGTPWPVNQAVYVDYMLYGLRGYNGIAAEEIAAIYRNNQEFSGHVNGWAHWLVYTPGMLYAVAQNFLLSGDRQSFDKLLPDTLKALDWTLAQIRGATKEPGPTQGIVAGPLNDLTGNGYWAFNQAYLYAGLDLMGKALARAGNPRAEECRKTADEFRTAVERGFRAAAVRSPLVQLRDHTWIPYVPCEATKQGRIYEQWYPTDVDTGAVHLLRLKALPSDGDLAESLLNDHEDNLFLGGLGMANEPVYNQQSTAYLLRDDVKATIRAFYSQMASGFSQSVLEPVEHRWRWGQFFGPPSTDGSWFEVYRNMLVREFDDETLLLAQATPRRWLEDGKRIEVKRAPTWFGNVSFEIQSLARSGSIRATFQLDERQSVKSVLLRLRHPDGMQIRHVTVNGEAWHDFDAAKEWVRIPNPGGRAFTVLATY